MGERHKIDERIRRKQAEINTLEEKLKTAKIYLSALRDVLKLLDSEAIEEPDTPETRLKPGSSVARAREIILERGGPVHIDDLLNAMGRTVAASSRSSLVSSISAYVRKEEIFTRTAPNTFGLLELGHNGEQIEDEPDDEPPSGFGREPVATQGWNHPDDDIPF